jgi:integrase/recombinase XerD
MTPIAPLITSFLQDYMPRQRGYSLQTCETYAVSFKLLLEYAATRTGTRPSRLAIEQLDAPLIVAFLAYIEQERGNGAATRNLRLAAIRSFMRYVEHHVPSALAQVGRHPPSDHGGDTCDLECARRDDPGWVCGTGR